MQDETRHSTSHPLAIVSRLGVEAFDGVTIRVTVFHGDGPVHAWVPLVFFSDVAAETWLRDRGRDVIRPALRDCDESAGNDQVLATVIDTDGRELVISEPVDRITGAGVAAMLAAAIRRTGSS